MLQLLHLYSKYICVGMSTKVDFYSGRRPTRIISSSSLSSSLCWAQISSPNIWNWWVSSGERCNFRFLLPFSCWPPSPETSSTSLTLLWSLPALGAVRFLLKLLPHQPWLLHLTAAPLHLVVHLVLSFLCCSAQSLFVLSYILVDLFIKDILKATWQSLCWDVPFCCWRFSTWPFHLSTFPLKSLKPSSPSASLSHCNQPILPHSHTVIAVTVELPF